MNASYYLDDNSYNTTFDLKDISEDNVVYLKCKLYFFNLYGKDLDLVLYKELIVLARNYKNHIHCKESSCGFITYIHIAYGNELYCVKFNQIDELIKSFLQPKKGIAKNNGLTISIKIENTKNLNNTVIKQQKIEMPANRPIKIKLPTK